MSYQISESITINSIEDMVKIADEIGQPIFITKWTMVPRGKLSFLCLIICVPIIWLYSVI